MKKKRHINKNDSIVITTNITGEWTKRVEKKKLELPIADRETKNELNEYINNKSKSQRMETPRVREKWRKKPKRNTTTTTTAIALLVCWLCAHMLCGQSHVQPKRMCTNKYYNNDDNNVVTRRRASVPLPGNNNNNANIMYIARNNH